MLFVSLRDRLFDFFKEGAMFSPEHELFSQETKFRIYFDMKNQ
jgi:hypothetical protein